MLLLPQANGCPCVDFGCGWVVLKCMDVGVMLMMPHEITQKKEFKRSKGHTNNLVITSQLHPFDIIIVQTLIQPYYMYFYN